MFHPSSPSPCFLYAWSGFQAIEAIFAAMADALPGEVPAGSGGDTCSLIWWGTRVGTAEPWADGAPHPIGQGAHALGDGACSQMHHGEASCRFPPVEIWEARNPWLLERVELAADSGGAGTWRGGLGVDMFFHILEDCWVTSALERTKLAPWGIRGGRDGRPNSVRVRHPDGSHTPSFGKATGLALRRGSTVELQTGGGGGFGPPEDRDPAAVHEDVRLGYTSEEQARTDYPHAYHHGGSA